MPYKRGRSGARLDPPLYISGTLQLSAVNTYTEEAINLNTNPVGVGSTKIAVLEKVWIWWSEIGATESAPGTSAALREFFSLHFGTRTAFVNISDPFTILSDERRYIIESPAATDFWAMRIPNRLQAYHLDTLLAPNTINIGYQTAAFTGTGTINYRVFYRVKQATQKDYFSILQSQTATN